MGTLITRKRRSFCVEMNATPWAFVANYYLSVGFALLRVGMSKILLLVAVNIAKATLVFLTYKYLQKVFTGVEALSLLMMF